LTTTPIKTEKQRGVSRIASYIVAVLSLSLVFSFFYFSGWFTLGKEVSTSVSTSNNHQCSISKAMSECRNNRNGLVKICGTIISDAAQCCDYYIKDETGEILIEDSSYGLLLPSRVGRKATIFGKLVKRGLTFVITDARIEFH
jgi:hypothetical protein